MSKGLFSWFAGLFFLSWAVTGYCANLPDFTELAEKQSRAVVNISTTQTVRGQSQFPNIPEDDPFYEFFRRFMPPQGPQQEYQTQSLGSGFIVTADGYILTNSHVVQAADEILVKLNDQREYKAKVIGADRRADVALIKIEAVNLPKVAIGDPTKLKVGEWVVAIGSPFGFDSTVTAGIVSAKGRTLPQETIVPFIQTDVAINPGNSGGPLFNMDGEVVGVNSQIYSRTGGFMGLSFAIPIDVAMNVADQLRTTGRVSRGWLGVVVQPVSKELADSFSLAKAEGALISSVEKGSPADTAGLEPSDVVLRIDGKPILTNSDLSRFIAANKPGNKVTLDIWRKGGAKQINVTLGELPSERAQGKPQKRMKAEEGTPNRLGLVLADLTAEQRSELGAIEGVLVQDAQGGAAKAGLARGDVILAVNNTQVRSVEQFNQAVSKLDPKRNVALLVRRGEQNIYLALKPSVASK
jgi:serine protease Do